MNNDRLKKDMAKCKTSIEIKEESDKETDSNINYVMEYEKKSPSSIQ
jgi:hypothetical protein